MAAAEKEVVVPDIGDYKNVEIIEVLVKPGDIIKADDSLITLESDKAAMEVPSPFGGVVKSMRVSPGDKVSQGSPILVLDIVGAGTAAAAPEAPKPAPAPVAESVPSAPATPQPAPPPVAEAPKPAPVAGPVSGPVEREVVVPDIGDFKDIGIIEVLVKPGDVVKADDSLITLESDKAAMEVPAPFGGVVKAMRVKSGDKVNKGSVILVLETSEGGAVAAPAPVAKPEPPKETQAPAPQPPVQAPPVVAEPVAESSEGRKIPPHASPAIRRFARELGANLERIQGSGPKGRILKEDVQDFIKASLKRAEQAPAAAPAPVAGGFALPPIPDIDFSKFGSIDSQPLSRIQKLSGAGLHRNWIGIPHVTQHDEADITELEAFRQSLKAEAEKRGVKLTFLPFVIKAVVAALKTFPSFNASLAAGGETLILKRYFHMGVAVDTPDGLVVPVIRDVDRKSIFELGAELADLGNRARNKKLRNTDMEGGCFTISSLGGIGGTAFTPIINAPEVAILGLSKSQMKPVYQDGQFVPRLMLPLSVSYDHRVIDGAQAARFVVYLAGVLADLRRVLL